MYSYPQYEGVEELGGFTPSRLYSYRQMLLAKSKEQIAFIREHIPINRMSVVEIGTGNGRLLIGMQQEGYLSRGIGLEISHSRVQFAQQWADDLNIHTIDFVKEDVLKWRKTVHFDLSVCITGCFQYFYPIDPAAPQYVLQFMRESSEYSLFEIYNRPQLGRTWKELPPDDPWAYILDEYVDNAGDWITHTKRFIHKDGHTDIRTENLAYYTEEVFIGHLWRAGFTNVLATTNSAAGTLLLVS